MAQFRMKIAGCTAEVTTLFESAPEYFRPYLTEDAPDFSIVSSRDDLQFEQDMSIEEAKQEGFRIRIFPDPFLERAAVQRRFAEYLFDRNTLLFHGSAVAVDGAGYLFTAKSGTGKSTHTRLWRQVFGDRAVMVNDDKPFLRIRDEDVLMYGSPWSGKHGLDSNITVPLKGICVLRRGKENVIRRISPADALTMLRHESYCPLDPGRLPRFLELVNSLAEKVPLWSMECSKNPQAAEVSYSAMSAADHI